MTNNETNMEIINEVAETGMEIVTKTAGNNDLLKEIGKGAGYAAAGIAVYEVCKALFKLGKSKFGKKKKNETEPAKTSDEKTENIEG